jgi:hypothetical protein
VVLGEGESGWGGGGEVREERGEDRVKGDWLDACQEVL